MRHINKFNEALYNNTNTGGLFNKPKPFNIENFIDIEYINGCFSNLIDEADVDYEVDNEDQENKKTYELVFYLDDVKKSDNGTQERIDGVLSHITELKELLEEIESSIKKVQIQYPGLVPNIDIEHSQKNRGVNSMLSDLNPIECISLRYNEDSIDEYMTIKNKKR